MPSKETHRNSHRAHDGSPLRERAAEVVTEAASLAQQRAVKASHSAADFVRDHPFAFIGVSLAGGIAVGALAHDLLAHQATMKELVAERLGLPRLRNRLRGAVCH